MRFEAIPYPADSADLFETLADAPWAVFLDSSDARPGAPRVDILSAWPWKTLVCRDGRTEISGPEGNKYSDADPFALLRAALGPQADVGELPFAGGAMGYFAYDLGRRIERLPQRARCELDLPDMAVGLYDWAVVVEHGERRAWLVGAERDPETARRWPELLVRFRNPPPPSALPPLAALGPVLPDLSRAQYDQAFARIQHYIREGDCYQVNLAQGFSATVAGDPWSAYRRLRRLSPAPHAAYLRLPFMEVLSSSPEQFLRVRQGEVRTRPIKGTRPRAADPRADAALAAELGASAKDRAENLMIVDLLRNDLGKVCVPGSVRVPELFRVEGYANVHHLVSTIDGRLAPGVHALDLLRAAFPGGSITGAPKLRAMQIIEELEPARRGVYCGAIGYIGHDGNMDSSIAIRTLVHRAGRVRFSAGGGIVADSQADAEYQECLDKAGPMFRLLGAQ
jgi:para-aminobenzoate synthetase component 1